MYIQYTLLYTVQFSLSQIVLLYLHYSQQKGRRKEYLLWGDVFEDLLKLSVGIIGTGGIPSIDSDSVVF